ncbi:glycosyltransferase [Hansschlegelia beijingensis]
MKFCIISHAHPDFSKGGGEIAAYRQFLTQRRRGDAVTIVAASPLLTDQPSGSNALIVEANPGEYVFSYQGMHPDYLAWQDSAARDRLVSFLAGLDADVYHFHHYWRIGVDLIDALLDMKPQARLFLTLHEMLAICANHGQMIRPVGSELCDRATPLRCLACFPSSNLSQIVARKALILHVIRRMARVIYPSNFIRGRYEAWGVPARIGVVLENYLGEEAWSFDRRRRLEDDPAGLERSFAFFGQATEFKGIDTLIDAFALALHARDDLTLTFYGPREEDVVRLFPRLAKTIESQRTRIFFAGRYGANEVFDLMQSAGWIVVPSIWWENSPVVIQEAKRANVPLIVSNIGGMAEKVVNGVDGLHFRRGSAVDLASTILMAATPELHRRVSHAQADSVSEGEFLDGLDAAYGLGSEPQSDTQLELEGGACVACAS